MHHTLRLIQPSVCRKKKSKKKKKKRSRSEEDEYEESECRAVVCVLVDVRVCVWPSWSCAHVPVWLWRIVLGRCAAGSVLFGAGP